MNWKPNKHRAERTRNDSILEAFDTSGKKLLWSGRLVDYSSTGAAFLSDRNLSIGETVNARIRIFTVGCLKVTGKVVRMEKKNDMNLYAIKYDTVEEINPTGEKKNYDGR
ncbi:MAG: hypothetical protein Fur0012_06360 [Elusimicrobiota bacterium]